MWHEQLCSVRVPAVYDKRGGVCSLAVSGLLQHVQDTGSLIGNVVIGPRQELVLNQGVAILDQEEGGFKVHICLKAGARKACCVQGLLDLIGSTLTRFFEFFSIACTRLAEV